MPIKHDVVGAPHSGNAVNRKTAPLVKTDAHIEHQQRKNHCVNNRAGYQILRAIGDQPAKEILFKLEVCGLDRAFKLHPLALDLKEHFAFLLLNRCAQVAFQRGHLGQNPGNLFVHDAAPVLFQSTIERHPVNF
ncbi:MAG: hypothetical protein NTZ64_13285 [Polaromonas sp.]|nr:hypothetical protein [Polaromonas sp.]